MILQNLITGIMTIGIVILLGTSAIFAGIRRTSIATIIIWLVVMLLGTGARVAGIIVNTSTNLTPGIYIKTSDPISKGSYVIFCPPPPAGSDEAKTRWIIKATTRWILRRGKDLCDSGYSQMLTRILATKDDVLTVSDDGVYVNKKLLPLSKPLEADSGDQPLPHFRVDNYILGEDEVLVMSDVNHLSFDSRYFGPINRSQIITTVRPILTW